MIVQIGALVGLSLVAAGMGWFSGQKLNAENAPAKTTPAKPAAGHGGGHDAKAGEHDAKGAQTVIDLPELMTNIAAPADTWVRLEMAIVLDEPQGSDLPGIIHQDLLAYVRTVKLHQLAGASGFQHFKSDLEERAAIRSEGHVKRVLIKTMLFE